MNHRDKVTIDSFSTLERELYDAIQGLETDVEALELITSIALTLGLPGLSVSLNGMPGSGEGSFDIFSTDFGPSASGGAGGAYTYTIRRNGTTETFAASITLNCSDWVADPTTVFIDFLVEDVAGNKMVFNKVAAVSISDPGGACTI